MFKVGSLIPLSLFICILVSCPDFFFLLLWYYHHTVNSVLIVLFSISLVNILSIIVAQWDATLLGLIIWGDRLILYIVLMNSSFMFVYFFIQQINIGIPTNEKSFPTYFWKHFLHSVPEQFTSLFVSKWVDCVSIYVTYQDLYAFLFHRRFVICSSTHSHQGVYSICLQILHVKTNLSCHCCFF